MTPVCDECKNELSEIEDWRHGDTICSHCGKVNKERLIDIEHEEKRTFSSDRATSGRKEDNSRTARSQPFSDTLSTGIGFDPNPNSSTSEASKQLSSLQNSMISYKDQKIHTGLQQITTICESLKLTDKVKGRAREIWNEFETARKKYSRAGDQSMYLAIVYTACKQEGVGRSFKEICQAFRGDYKQITRSYKRLSKLLQDTTAAPKTVSAIEQPVDVAEEHPRDAKARDNRNKGTSASDMLPRICQKLKLEYQIQSKAQELAKSAASLLEGKHPNTIAAAALLYHLHQSKEATVFDKDVAKAAGVAPSTMRSAYRVLIDSKLSVD